MILVFQTIQFSISMQLSSIWPIDKTLSRATTPSQWTREWWLWRGTPHSPKLLHYWSLTIRLFSVISRTLVGGGLTPLQSIIINFHKSKDHWNIPYLEHYTTSKNFQNSDQMISENYIRLKPKIKLSFSVISVD